jgi:hypothetical protein
MKIYKFNENWLSRKLNKDEVTSEGIYKSILDSDISESDVTYKYYPTPNWVRDYTNINPNHIDTNVPDYLKFGMSRSGWNGGDYDAYTFSIDLDGFKIVAVRFYGTYGTITGTSYYYILVDEAVLSASQNLSKNIYTELKSIAEGKRKLEYAKKDAKIHFANKVKK